MAEQPSNSDILREVKNIHAILKEHEERLKPLEQWKIAYDAADAAITKYKAEHLVVANMAGGEKGALFGEGVSKDFVNITLKFLGILGGIVGILALVLEYFLK